MWDISIPNDTLYRARISGISQVRVSGRPATSIQGLGIDLNHIVLDLMRVRCKRIIFVWSRNFLVETVKDKRSLDRAWC